MKIKTNGLSYVGDVDTFSRYTLFLEGRRVMDVLVDNAIVALDAQAEGAPEGVTAHPIYISMVDAPTNLAQATKGIAARKPYLGETGVTNRISADTVAAYVLPRAAILLARLFVPAA